MFGLETRIDGQGITFHIPIILEDGDIHRGVFVRRCCVFDGHRGIVDRLEGDCNCSQTGFELTIGELVGGSDQSRRYSA